MPLRVLSLLVLLVAAPVAAAASDSPLSPSEAPKHMTLPEGFHATLFAGEPDVVQPIAFTFDHRGRLWVVECLSYPDWQRDGDEGGDRVVVFEDLTGDGRFDTRKVFWDKGRNLSGIEVGFGGAWLCSTPEFLFIPDRDGDDVPDGPPVVLLDGWSLEARHNVFNALTWGPDGWLYGGNGILATSNIGKPGTPEARRVPLNCGVWRYHPTRHEFEVVAWGTTNPWGLDFDEHGEMFITNCVIEHVFHVVPGAHFKRMYGEDLNPHVYGLIESCADHIHWGGGHWTDSRGGQGEHDHAGGGHAHAGAMVYLGDNWPDRYRGALFTCNIHGHRVNMDDLDRERSGYVATHGKDFLLANDTWFRGLEMKYGPDGGVYLTDWTDTGECHDYEDIHRENGRIYKITYGETASARVDLERLGDRELVELQLHRNEWHVRHARQVLQERAAAGRLHDETRAALWDLYRRPSHPDAKPNAARNNAGRTAADAGSEEPEEGVTRKLRAAWALHVTGGLTEAETAELLDSPHEAVRAWAVRIELEDRKVSPELLGRLTRLAADDPSPLVRLHLASGLQRLPTEQRRPIAERLVTHADDSDDPNLPLMIWYGIEPLVAADPSWGIELLTTAQIPLVRQYIARRIASL